VCARSEAINWIDGTGGAQLRRSLGILCRKIGLSLDRRYIAEQDKRWVVVAPPGSHESALLLARAGNPEQASRKGNQTGGRVFLFLRTDDFWRDYDRYKANGIVFVRDPRKESYGMVAVFEDIYGNLWDLLQ
jgi:hypothetical protein